MFAGGMFAGQLSRSCKKLADLFSILFKFGPIWTDIITEQFTISGVVAIVTRTNVAWTYMMLEQMLHGQILDGQISLGHLSTVKDGSTNLE